jgi:hypothetical protein
MVDFILLNKLSTQTKMYITSDEHQRIAEIAKIAAIDIMKGSAFKRITALELLSKMDELSHTVKDASELSEGIRIYATRYKFDILRGYLMKNGVPTYSIIGTRGFYISTTLTLEDLAYEVELMKMKRAKSPSLSMLMANAHVKALKSLSTQTKH